MSGLLHDTSAGGEVLISGPYGSTVLDRDTAPLLIASAGIGITQALALLRALRPEHRIVFCHTARDERSLALWPEVAALAAELPNARLLLQLSAGTTESCRRLGAAPGRPDLGAIAARYFAEPTAIAAYLCGPPGFLRDARTSLTGRGVAGERIRHEVCASPRGVPATTPRRAGRRRRTVRLPVRRLPAVPAAAALRRGRLPHRTSSPTGTRHRPPLLRRPHHPHHPPAVTPTCAHTTIDRARNRDARPDA
jgi:ferredoxin-NADP reductase